MRNGRLDDITTEPQKRGYCIRCGEIAHSPLKCETSVEDDERNIVDLEHDLKEHGVIRSDAKSVWR